LCRVTLPVVQSDMRFAAEAAHWVECFYAGTRAEVRGDEVELFGDVSAERLEQLWNATLLNERLHGENDERRRRLLSGLTQ